MTKKEKLALHEEAKKRVPIEWKEFFMPFLDMRLEIGKPMTPRAVDLVVKKLNNSCANIDEIEYVINESIMNSWQGLFPNCLKTRTTVNKFNQKTKTKHNYFETEEE